MTDRELDALVAEEVMGWRWRAFKSDWDAPKWAKDIYPPDAVELSWPDEPGAPPLAELPYRRSAHYLDMPHYSSDIAAAWQVVERMRDLDFYATIGQDWPGNEGLWEVDFSKDGDVYFYAAEHSVSRAICLAARKALGAEVNA